MNCQSFEGGSEMTDAHVNHQARERTAVLAQRIDDHEVLCTRRWETVDRRLANWDRRWAQMVTGIVTVLIATLLNIIMTLFRSS